MESIAGKEGPRSKVVSDLGFYHLRIMKLGRPFEVLAGVEFSLVSY